MDKTPPPQSPNESSIQHPPSILYTTCRSIDTFLARTLDKHVYKIIGFIIVAYFFYFPACQFQLKWGKTCDVQAVFLQGSVLGSVAVGYFARAYLKRVDSHESIAESGLKV